MKAINTEYSGYLFRSRLEARWAVFFDTLGWEYKYEPEGFILSNGTPYLPDFYLPEINTWVEVKPEYPHKEDMDKCKLLSLEIGTEYGVMLVYGLPDKIQYPHFWSGDYYGDSTLTSYIKSKRWTWPYVNGDWWPCDDMAFDRAKKARFEFGQKG